MSRSAGHLDRALLRSIEMPPEQYATRYRAWVTAVSESISSHQESVEAECREI
ncbi:MAG: hypothetical protein WBF52_03840 [Geitlerinemataceae cyanobacterium]